MNVLITGGKGFLGKEIQKVLQNHYSLFSLGRKEGNDIRCDLATTRPEIEIDLYAAIHVAGKAHIYPKTEQEIHEFFDVNEKGTVNLLHSLTHKGIKHFVFISSVSVYGLSHGQNISEETKLAGNSPYALSKIKAEELITEWCLKHNVHYLILRLPLIAAKDAPGNLGAMIKGIKSGKYARIALGTAHKSMVHAEDVAELICRWLLTDNPISGIYNLTDGIHPTFFEIEEKIKLDLGTKRIFQIPEALAKILALTGDVIPFFPLNTSKLSKITDTFTFNDQKARKELGWNPKPALSRPLA